MRERDSYVWSDIEQKRDVLAFCLFTYLGSNGRMLLHMQVRNGIRESINPTFYFYLHFSFQKASIGWFLSCEGLCFSYAILCVQRPQSATGD